MGVNGLWQIVSSVNQRCSLEELRGKRLAVDLSFWICELSQTKALAAAVVKPYLRNLFYRILRLHVEYGVSLVFVIDGAATPMKWATMDRRMAASGQGKEGGRTTKIRHQLNSRVRECCELLDAVGIPYINSQGEAEAMCALLNQNGMVDGVLTEDSDTFLYGATVVYRQLSTTEPGSRVDKYTMDSISDSLGLARRDLVAMAVLLGCDYLPQGVPGIGKEKVLQLIREGVDLLGLLQKRSEDQPISSSPALRLVRKAMDIPSWKQTADMVVEEFLFPKETLPSYASIETTRQPNLVALQEACHKLMDWSYQYTLGKSYPLLTHWVLVVKSRGETTDIILPTSVSGQKIVHGVRHYSVEWKSSLPRVEEGIVTGSEWVFTTLQRNEHMEEHWPILCQEFKDKQKPRKKSTKSRKVSAATVSKEPEDLVKAMASLSHEHKSVTPITSPAVSPLKRSSPSKRNSPSKLYAATAKLDFGIGQTVSDYSSSSSSSPSKQFSPSKLRAATTNLHTVLDYSSSSDEEPLPLLERLRQCQTRSEKTLRGHEDCPIVLSD